MSPAGRCRLALGLWLLCGCAAAGQAGNAADAPAYGQAAFVDRRDPPAHAALTPAQREAYELGHAIFNTPWVPAGAPRAERRDGLGPLFNAATCDSCHNEGARGQGLGGDGLLPAAMVLQLGGRPRPGSGDDAGDPVYGHALNTAAIAGFRPEGVVAVRYRLRSGRYPDGSAWQLRVPQYELRDLAYGALAPRTILKPRMSPALFGAGLLEAVPESEFASEFTSGFADAESPGRVAWQNVDGQRRAGRFGWQAGTVSVADQTTRAFAREMGLTSREVPQDDCSAAQRACREAADGGKPEVSSAFMDALLAFQIGLAVPQAPARSEPTAGVDADASGLFAGSGCAGCHRPRLNAVLDGAVVSIAPYTDLRVHDLGDGLADRDLGGRRVLSEWRTAPLWGLGHALRYRDPLALLHDGRARSVEEAILWHDGEAASARRRYERLSAAQRQRLIDWIGSL